MGGRPELIVVGTDDPKGEWHDYHFFNKPGDPNTFPPFVMPHQPRFEWQMWFSALDELNMQQYYLIHFLYKLFNNDNHAKLLLKEDPFKNKAPP